tara:strand:- start:702 stop:1019 length:318 start_codon:yes stop_codon:yes gene_type:complete
MRWSNILILFSIILFLYSCSSISEGFSNNKKNSSDEFLVEKKSPLVMPPDFNDLPSPKTGEENSNIKENEIKKLLTDKGSDVSIDNSKKGNSSFENELLKKIKKN